MSCRKCGYRFLWELKRGEIKNKCPICFAVRGWSEAARALLAQLAPVQREDEVSGNALDTRRWYWRRKTRPDEVAHPERIDRISKSTDIGAGAGEPQIYKISSSFALPSYDEKTSHGWRPWSRIETSQGVTSPAVGDDGVRGTFDRQYSRSYSRFYSMPYNNADKPKDYSYPTSYSGRRDASHFSVPGSNREVLERPGRDYKSLMDESYRVKSYNRKIARNPNM